MNTSSQGPHSQETELRRARGEESQMHSFQCCGRQWRRGECVADVGGRPILGNILILSMRGWWGKHHWETHQGSTQNSTDTLKQPKGSQFKVTGSSSIKPGRMFCPEGQLVSLGTTRKESSEANSGTARRMGLPGKDGIGAVGLQSLPPQSSGLSLRTHGPPAARPPISLNSVQCPVSNLLTDFLPQIGASGGEHAQCGRLVLVLLLESQL